MKSDRYLLAVLMGELFAAELYHIRTDLILIGIYDALKILNLIPDRFIIIINQ